MIRRSWLLVLGALLVVLAIAGGASGQTSNEPETFMGTFEWGTATTEPFATGPKDGPCLPGECVSACSDAYDNDGDGLIDYGNDPGCYGPQDNDEYNAPAPPPPPPPAPPPPPPPPPSPTPPPPPPPPTEPESFMGDFAWTGSSEQDCFTGLQFKDPMMCYATDGAARCKYQTWETTMQQRFSPLGPQYRALTFKGWYRVCYVPNDHIVEVKGRFADCYDAVAPWQCDGVASGYPYHVRFEHRVEFHYRIRACIVAGGCTIKREPWVNITFFDNNTQSFVQGRA